MFFSSQTPLMRNTVYTSLSSSKFNSLCIMHGLDKYPVTRSLHSDFCGNSYSDVHSNYFYLNKRKWSTSEVFCSDCHCLAHGTHALECVSKPKLASCSPGRSISHCLTNMKPFHGIYSLLLEVVERVIRGSGIHLPFRGR